MTALMYLAMMVSLFCAVGLGASLIWPQTPRSVSQRVLEATRSTATNTAAPGKRQQLTHRLFNAVPWIRARLGIPENAVVQEQLRKAGLKSAAHTNAYLTARVGGPLLALITGMIMPSYRLLAIAVLGGITYLAPDIVLKRLIKRRREKIRRSIPEAVDLLVICVDAGLGLDQALLRAGQELSQSHPEINDEFLRINQEQRAGKLRIDAWKDMAKRTDLPDVDAFVNMLIQTERFGTPIARALSNFSDNIRMKRRQKAEELAAKTTVKIIFPLVLFIFPSMFVVLIGPAAINIIRGMSSAGH